MTSERCQKLLNLKLKSYLVLVSRYLVDSEFAFFALLVQIVSRSNFLTRLPQYNLTNSFVVDNTETEAVIIINICRPCALCERPASV